MQTFFGKMSESLTQKLLSGIEGYFGTHIDPEQVPTTFASNHKLLDLHPNSVATIFSDNEELVASVAVVPTTRQNMELFMNGKFSEKELFDKTTVGDRFDSLYLMSAFVAPNYRRQGIALELSSEVVEKVDPQKTMTLFAWPTSDEGRALTQALVNKINRRIQVRKQ